MKPITAYACIALALAALGSDPVVAQPLKDGKSSVFSCKFPKTGQVKIDYGKGGPTGVVVTMKGRTHAYSTGSYFIEPSDESLPTLAFKPGMKRWAILDDTMEEVEVAQCKEVRS